MCDGRRFQADGAATETELKALTSRSVFLEMKQRLISLARVVFAIVFHNYCQHNCFLSLCTTVCRRETFHDAFVEISNSWDRFLERVYCGRKTDGE